MWIKMMNSLFLDFTVQQREPDLEESDENSQFDYRNLSQSVDDGYSGSQDSNTKEDEDILSEFFTETPSLHDCSFTVLCAQASGIPVPNYIPFADVWEINWAKFNKDWNIICSTYVRMAMKVYHDFV